MATVFFNNDGLRFPVCFGVNRLFLNKWVHASRCHNIHACFGLRANNDACLGERANTFFKAVTGENKPNMDTASMCLC